MSGLTNKQKLEVIQKLLENIPAKSLAYLYDTTIDTIYELRNRFLIQKWVLKRDPKDKFNLD